MSKPAILHLNLHREFFAQIAARTTGFCHKTMVRRQ